MANNFTSSLVKAPGGRESFSPAGFSSVVPIWSSSHEFVSILLCRVPCQSQCERRRQVSTLIGCTLRQRQAHAEATALARYRPVLSMSEAEQRLRVVVQDPGPHPRAPDRSVAINAKVSRYVLVLLQHRIVAAGHQLCPRRTPRTRRSTRPSTHSTPYRTKPPRGHARNSASAPRSRTPCLSSRFSSMGIGPPRCGTMKRMRG